MPVKLLQTLESHTDRVWTVVWNPSGTILASSGGDKKIRLWSKEGSESKWYPMSILENSHQKTIRRISWSPCGQYIASASFDSTICVWRMNSEDKTWSNVYNLEGHESEVKSVAWSYDGNYLATCGRDKIVWIWERATGESNDTDGEDEEDSAKYWDCSDIKNDHTKDVKHVVWHPKFNILASCSYDDTVKLFHKTENDWKCYQTLTSHSSTVWSADFSSTGEFLVTCSEDKTVRIWKNHAHSKLPDIEPNSWKCISTIQGYHGRTIYDVSWNKLNDVIVSGSGDNSLAFYGKSLQNSSGEAQVEMFVCLDRHKQSHECDINTVAWNPKVPSLLASGSDDRTVKLWEFTIDEQGMITIDRPLTIVEEILTSLKKASISSDTDVPVGQQSLEQQPSQLMNTNITDFSILLNNIKSLQNLQTEISTHCDGELCQLEYLFDLKLDIDHNIKPVEITKLVVNEEDGCVIEMRIDIITGTGQIEYSFRYLFDSTKFKLRLPKRSCKLMVVATELFLLEKTGDMYKILDSGESVFLLGHLFTFSDVKFMLKDKNEIRYLLTSDRDEKIRLSNYPETYRIERFCFGHKSFIRRLVVVDNDRFISIDHENNVFLWNLSDLGYPNVDNNCLLKPEKTVSMVESATKRVKL